jgi:hypothetical protein
MASFKQPEELLRRRGGRQVAQRFDTHFLAGVLVERAPHRRIGAFGHEASEGPDDADAPLARVCRRELLQERRLELLA